MERQKVEEIPPNDSELMKQQIRWCGDNVCSRSH